MGVVVGREAPGAAFQLELVAVLVLKVSDRKNHVYILYLKYLLHAHISERTKTIICKFDVE